MNYTNNYHLPQWEKSDRVLMEDFNEAMAGLEAGLTSAQTKADAAYSPDQPPYIIGTYTGGGETETVVEVGFRPRFILVTGQMPGREETEVRYVMAVGPGLMTGAVRFQDQGFSIRTIVKSNSGTPDHPHMNLEGKIYTYIAFR